ncbi:MAG: hypothetical protein NVS4B12_07670 [Ktedonobacteraceae bacterium]
MSPEPSPNKIGKSVGEKIRAARVALHYTQSKLAAPDFSVSYISAIERGQIHPSLRALEILAGRLGLASIELLPKRPHQDERQSTSPPQPEREDDEGEMVLLEVQVRISQNEPEKALALLNKISAKRLKRLQQLWHRYLLGYAYFLTDRLQECEHIFSEMVQIVKDANNFYLHTHILFILGKTFAAMQNSPQALLAYQRCLNVLEEAEVQDAFLIARVSTQLGIQYIEMDQPEAALHMFRKALDTIEEGNQVPQTYTTYNALVQQAVNNHDYHAATLYGNQAFAYATQEQQKRLKGELYHYLGQAILKGDGEEAYVQLKAMKEKEASHPLIKASITARLAEWHFTRQHTAEARICAEEAYLLARPFGETIIIADASLILGRIDYVEQAFDRGDEHFVQGLAILEHLQSQGELTEQSICYAQLLEARGKDREAFIYLRRAYQRGMHVG